MEYIYGEIFSHLCIDDLRECCLVNKKWNEYLNSNTIWFLILKKRNILPFIDDKKEGNFIKKCKLLYLNKIKNELFSFVTSENKKQNILIGSEHYYGSIYWCIEECKIIMNVDYVENIYGFRIQEKGILECILFNKGFWKVIKTFESTTIEFIKPSDSIKYKISSSLYHLLSIFINYDEEFNNVFFIPNETYICIDFLTHFIDFNKLLNETFIKPKPSRILPNNIVNISLKYYKNKYQNETFEFYIPLTNIKKEDRLLLKFYHEYNLQNNQKSWVSERFIKRYSSFIKKESFHSFCNFSFFLQQFEKESNEEWIENFIKQSIENHDKNCNNIFCNCKEIIRY